MSYMQFQQQCTECFRHWNAAFGIVGTTQIAAPPTKCPYCGSEKLTKIADQWDSEPVASPQATSRCADNDPSRYCRCGGERGNPSCMFPDAAQPAAGTTERYADVKTFWPYQLIRSLEGTNIELIDDACTPKQAADGLRAIADWLLEDLADEK